MKQLHLWERENEYWCLVGTFEATKAKEKASEDENKYTVTEIGNNPND